MNAPMAGPHVMAVLNVLKDELPQNITPALGVAPAKGKAYVVLYPDSGDVSWSRLCMTQSDIRVRIMVHAVGEGPEQCMHVMDNARAALIGKRPEVEGRTVRQITQTLGPQPMTRDQSLQPPMFLQVAEFTITSQKA